MPWSSVLDGQLGDPSRFTGPHSEDLEDEISVAGADGETRWIRFRVSRPPAQGGYGHFAIVQLLDVTSHVGLESVLREQVRAKNDFIATVSHELRTPLTAVVGFVDELGGALVDPSGEALEMLEILAAESTSLSNIVEDLLVAARADIDQLSVAQETVDLSDVINRVIRASSRLALDHGASINLKCSSAVATADSRRVEQILWNLITNAIRHGGSEITICARREDARVLMTVEDNGLGVPAKAIDEIFEPYRSFTLDQGVTTSMGLGLYVARKLAQLMGGDLSARVDGVRTEFVLELPGPQPVATAQLSLAE
jgi:signal transduction histidine kinase